MAEQAPQPMYGPEDMEGQNFQVQFIEDKDLGAASTDRFRETGQDFSQWAEEDPQGAYNALRRVIADSRYRGNDGAATEAGLQEQFSEPTTISVRVHRPTLRQRLTGVPADAARSEEVARFKFGQQNKKS